MPKVSIIVPVFNMESYLERSIESLQKQTMIDIQIILVNDGSTDRSLSICQEYAKNDSRILVIDKPNGGVSSARNAGLEVATGDYVGFVDPDDWIEPIMYEEMYNTIMRTQTELCMCNYIVEYPETSVSVTLPSDSNVLNKHDIIGCIVANLLAGPKGTSAIMGSVWRLLVSRDLIRKNALRFASEIYLMEDLIFCVETLLKCNTVSIDQGQYYHYIIRGNSATNKYWPDMFNRVHHVFDKLQGIVEKEECYPFLQERMDLRYVNMYLSVIANEVRVGNDKNPKEKIATIQQFCNDEKLQGILSDVDTQECTLRKKLVLTALRRQWGLFLFVYYTTSTSLFQRWGVRGHLCKLLSIMEVKNRR